jgi:glutathione S-transferase
MAYAEIRERSPMTDPLRLLGAPGSPYTRKMLAVLRYKRLPYALILGNHQSRTDLPRPKVALLPTFYLPDEAGAIEAVTDSTPLIRRFDAEYPARQVVPADPVLAFLDYLLEDFADEWLTKAMFHYRWHYAADADKGGEILPRWRVTPTPEAALAPVKAFIRERQISRLYVVGSNQVTAPVIEASYRRILAAMAAHIEAHAFLLGARPGGGDFGFYGQLTQLTKFDPTPMAIAVAEAPRVYAWVDVVDDLSGLEPTDEDWLAPDALPESLTALFHEMGRTYTPVMLANAAAVKAKAERVETEVDGRPWTQHPFPYQARCLAWIREGFDELSPIEQSTVRGILDGTGCEPLLG